MEKILVIEDDADVRELVSLMLSQAGHVVYGAPDGLTAAKLVDDKSVTLVVTDLVLPNGDGVETIHKFKREFPDIKVIAISGDIDYLEWAEKLGADRSLSKPFTRDGLLDAVSAVTGTA